MLTKEVLQGQWNEVKGRLQEHWGQLTDDDLARARGSADQLVGTVQQKTGATRREVEAFLSNILGDKHRVSETARQYADAAGEYATEAGEYLQENFRRVADVGDDYRKQLVRTVRSRPTESMAIAFGLGIAAGAFFFMKNRR